MESGGYQRCNLRTDDAVFVDKLIVSSIYRVSDEIYRLIHVRVTPAGDPALFRLFRDVPWLAHNLLK